MASYFPITKHGEKRKDLNTSDKRSCPVEKMKY